MALSFSHESRSGLKLISAPFGFSLLLLAAPLLLMFLLSFWTQGYLDLDRSLTLNNYREITSHPVYALLLKRSLIISLIVTAITILLAFPMAYYISFYGGKRKALWLFLVTIPFWTSYLLRIFLWKIILGYNGVINSTLQGLSIIDEPLTFILYNSNAVVIALAHAWAPFAILPIFVALEKIDRSLLEAARDLGDGSVRRFFRITLPLAMPGIIAASLIIFIPTIGDYVTPKLVGGTDGLMIANIIQVQFAKANNAPLGAALAVTAMVMVGVCSVIFVLLNRRWLKRRA
jgi:spermidine/putrescine transport system permease protein